MAHGCNPITLGGQGWWITWSQEFETAWSMWWNPVFTKSTKISWAWWHTLVIPAIREAEAGELLEPWTWETEAAVSWDYTTALQPGNRERLSQKKIILCTFPYQTHLKDFVEAYFHTRDQWFKFVNQIKSFQNYISSKFALKINHI